MLQRFIDAQEDTFDIALREIKAGIKRSHWMWYIFPQLKGLGRSSTSSYYGIAGLKEAQDYLSHPVLGARLKEISKVLTELPTYDAHSVFGYPDVLKLRSCMTLFDFVSPNDVFSAVLDKYFAGHKDNKTLRLLVR